MFITAVSIPWRLHCFTVFTIIMKIYGITVNREIFALFYFRPFCLDVVSGRILRRGELPCLKLSLSNHNFVWVNSRWGKTVCMGRLVTTFFTQAENKLAYGILLEEQCAKGINILRKHQRCNCNILSVILKIISNIASDFSSLYDDDLISLMIEVCIFFKIMNRKLDL